ncbi:MAG: hypothetical protein JXB46_11800 [Candidatus Eisenbacteria bacterium]|nr:hypothetical protein [Candidatus Eisenbacteria bacterium]
MSPDTGPSHQTVSAGNRVLTVLACWIALVYLWSSLDVKALAPIFPSSALDGPHLYRSGLPFAAGFLVVLWVALRLRLTPVRVWRLAVAPVLLANLAQGGYFVGLVRPLVHEGKQYAQDAMRIGDDWRLWLSQFTRVHDQLFSHTKTHPPFAVIPGPSTSTPWSHWTPSC